MYKILSIPKCPDVKDVLEFHGVAGSKADSIIPSVSRFPTRASIFTRSCATCSMFQRFKRVLVQNVHKHQAVQYHTDLKTFKNGPPGFQVFKIFLTLRSLNMFKRSKNHKAIKHCDIFKVTNSRYSGIPRIASWPTISRVASSPGSSRITRSTRVSMLPICSRDSRLSPSLT